jgi:hypothetical protein
MSIAHLVPQLAKVADQLLAVAQGRLEDHLGVLRRGKVPRRLLQQTTIVLAVAFRR